MEKKFPDFVWCLDTETRLEVDPQTESFIVEPHTEQGIRILRQNKVKVTSTPLYTCVERYHCDQLITPFRYSEKTLMT